MKKSLKDLGRNLFTTMLSLVIIASSLSIPVSLHAAESDQTTATSIIEKMTLDEKVSQLIIPAFRTWKADESSAEKNVTVLSDFPELQEALRRHQYGGVILYGANVADTEQVVRLTTDLQKNNAQIDATTNIPYFMPVDEEGGIVLRIGSGTRMTGNMAIGATGDQAETNAYLTGQILGRESGAAGFNVDFAPDADVNNNPANPVIGTRSFSDDPDRVANLAVAYNQGLKDNGIIGCYKHYPGHGDTGTDSHLNLASVDKSYEELQKTELVPFKNAIKQGADLIMTAHVTFPRIDDEVTFPDGSKGYYPATMSKKLIQEILRGDLGYDGVVVTDALEMGAIGDKQLVPGEIGSPEYCANVAELVINAGADILLLPLDMTGPKAVTFYDQYIEALIAKVEAGSISEDRINESLSRIIKLKDKSGILSMNTSGDDVEEAVALAKSVIGSSSHHQTEMDIARQAITLVRNEESALPLPGYEHKFVFLCRNDSDNVTIMRSIKGMQEEGCLDPEARIINRVTGTESGDEDAETLITIDSYQDGKYPSDMQSDVLNADYVIGLSKNFGLAGLQSSHWQYLGIKKAMDDVHSKGGKFILVSDNLPYDSARFQEADGILLAYMGAGLDTDPTDSTGESYTGGACNATVEAALQTAFDNNMPSGSLPVMVPTMASDEEGKVYYTDQTLYERGYGLGYTYQLTPAAGGIYTPGQSKGLSFTGNARIDLLTGSITVDGTEVAAEYVEVDFGARTIDLSSAYLDTLASGTHTLKALYSYQSGIMELSSEFEITQVSKKDNPLTAKGKTVKIKYSKVKKKAQTIKRNKIMTINNAQGSLSYQKIKVNKKKYAGKFLVNKNTGKLKVKKGVKKGVYKLQIKVTAAGNAGYKAGSKNVTVTVRVK